MNPLPHPSAKFKVGDQRWAYSCKLSGYALGTIVAVGHFPYCSSRPMTWEEKQPAYRIQFADGSRTDVDETWTHPTRAEAEYAEALENQKRLKKAIKRQEAKLGKQRELLAKAENALTLWGSLV